jgi:hypothetical protein
VAVFQFHLESRVGEVFLHLALHLYNVFLGHVPYLPGKPAPLKFAFLSRLSYWCDMM